MFLDFASSIAWPIVVVIVAIVFRRPIGKLINEIEEAVFPGGSLKRRGDRQIADIERAVGMPPRSTAPPEPEAATVEQIDGAHPDSRSTPALEAADFPGPLKRSGLWLSADAVPPIIPVLGDLRRNLPGYDAIRTYGADVAVFQAARSVELAMELCDGSVGENHDPLLSAWFRTMASELTGLAGAVRDGRTAMSIDGAMTYSATVGSFLEELEHQLENFTDGVPRQQSPN